MNILNAIQYKNSSYLDNIYDLYLQNKLDINYEKIYINYLYFIYNLKKNNEYYLLTQLIFLNDSKIKVIQYYSKNILNNLINSKNNFIRGWSLYIKSSNFYLKINGFMISNSKIIYPINDNMSLNYQIMKIDKKYNFHKYNYLLLYFKHYLNENIIKSIKYLKILRKILKNFAYIYLSETYGKLNKKYKEKYYALRSNKFELYLNYLNERKFIKKFPEDLKYMQNNKNFIYYLIQKY